MADVKVKDLFDALDDNLAEKNAATPKKTVRYMKQDIGGGTG